MHTQREPILTDIIMVCVMGAPVPSKTAEPIGMQFEWYTRVAPRNHIGAARQIRTAALGP